jgi:hypothetical protein
MSTVAWRLAGGAAAFLVGFLVIGCESSEVVAPEGATIDLTATPAQIVLANGVQNSPVTLLAVVRNGIGVPLPGQDVRFTTTSGILDPVAGTPVETDDNGNAICTLTGATTGPTITVSSGKAMDTLTLTAATGVLATIQLAPGIVPISSCGDTPTLTATALDPDGDPVEGVSIEVIVTDAGGSSVPNISFPDSPGVTDAMGEVTFTLTLVAGDCNTKCGSGMTCTATFVARNLGQTVQSNPATLQDNVP